MTLTADILAQPSFDAAIRTAVAGVKAMKPTYDWVGVYLLEEAPSTGSGQAPSTGSGQAPSAGSGQAPSAGSGQAPSAGSGQAPSTGSGQGVLTLRDEHYLGQPTSHTRIPLGSGICGASATDGETLVIDDVHADSRYIACSLSVQSEIVVPILAGERLVGVLDLDSDTPAAFGEADRRELEQVAGSLARAWQEMPGGQPAERSAPLSG